MNNAPNTLAGSAKEIVETVITQAVQLENTVMAMSEMADRFEDLAARIDGVGRDNSAEGDESAAPKPVLAMVPSLVASNISLLTSIERFQTAFANIKSTLGV